MPEGRRRCYVLAPLLWWAAALLVICGADDPSAYFDWTFTYRTVAPLGVPQQVIAVNGEFPGPTLNLTTNWNAAVNVQNNLNEPLLITWDGIQQRRNSWQDGVLGTNCPILPKWNWTYHFQVKDQIGSFFYFPSLNFQRAAGGYGEIFVHPRDVIPIPFAKPDGEITLIIGDWFNRDHADLRKSLDEGKDLGIPDGVLINGKGPYRYNASLVPYGIEFETINVEPGKTYRIRVHNVGIFTSLNFRIQAHNLLLVETEGSYTVQQNYSNLDIHVGQSYSFLVTMDQSPINDHYIVASARFVDDTWERVVGVAILHYTNSEGKASGPLPEGPQDFFYKSISMDQAKSIRWNLSASAARPNPQGSYKYGSINITETYLLKNKQLVSLNRTRRSTLNDISYVPPDTPLRLADQYNLSGVYTLDFPIKLTERPPRLGTSVIHGTYRGFAQIIFQNDDTKVQTFHLDGHSFFVVGMDFGNWTEENRDSYNMWDAVARCTTQVYPGAWTAVLVSLDNVGFWNLRAENLDTWYLGQETYIRVVNPEITDKTELPMPDNVLYCGRLQYLQKPQKHKSSSSSLDRAGGALLALILMFVQLSVLR